MAHYCSTKAGVQMLTKCAALALAPHHINVNCISPGIIIDGGITQYNAARKALETSAIAGIALISFAKPRQLVYGLAHGPTPLRDLPPEIRKLVKTAIDYTHNFAVRYHRSTQKKLFRSSLESQDG